MHARSNKKRDVRGAVAKRTQENFTSIEDREFVQRETGYRNQEGRHDGRCQFGTTPERGMGELVNRLTNHSLRGDGCFCSFSNFKIFKWFRDNDAKQKQVQLLLRFFEV